MVEWCMSLHTTDRSNFCRINPTMEHYFNETDSLHHLRTPPQPELVSMQLQHHEHGRELPLLDVAVALHIKTLREIFTIFRQKNRWGSHFKTKGNVHKVKSLTI